MGGPALAIVTGLQGEARLALRAVLKAGLGGGDVDVVCAGPGPERARVAAEGQVARGARMLLSFGVAGALVPELEPGAILVPAMVAEAGSEPLATDQIRTQMSVLALAAAGPLARGPLLSTREVIVSAAQKAELARATGAVAVDLESYAVGTVALKAGVPFAVLRAIADPAGRAIPPAALAGMTESGNVNPWNVVKGLAGTPRDVPELMALARDNARAMASLGRAARLALPLLLVGR